MSTGAGAREAPFTVPLLINGSEHRPDRTFDIISPSTGDVLHRCSAASVADATAAVNAAAEAFATWRRTTPSQRRDILLRASDIMNRRREELLRYFMDETGAAGPWGEFNINTASEMLKDIAGRIPTIEGSIPALGDPDSCGIVVREPYGVVLAIAPWNAPYILGTRAVAFPIAAGNTAVLKGSETAPRSLWAVASVLEEAGLPRGVLNFITHDAADAAEVTAAVVANPHVKKINFTGSTAVGRIIGKLVGEHLKPVVLELGGKAPAIVWEDADLQLAADQCATGAFLNSGQICMSTEKILVHRAIKQQFVDAFRLAVEKAFPSSGEAPTLINRAAVVKNKALVADAAGKGASVFGDVEAPEVGATSLRPAIVDAVTADMDIYRTESFGPTVSLIDVDSEEQAIRIANDSEYGLSAAVFTDDLRRGLRFARELETGAVHINGMTVHDEAALPHGGAKASGYGRFGSCRGLAEWVRTKNITFKH